jgi:hypothetical protein
MDAGATMLIYPKVTLPKDVARVRRIVGTRLQLVPVATIEDALAVLAPDGLPPAPPLPSDH